MKHYTMTTALTGFGAIVLALFGPWNGALQALIVLMVLDLLSGLIRAVIQKQLSSNIGYKGALKKVLILVIVVVGVQADVLIESGTTVRDLVVLFFCSSEALSILENAAGAGLPVPAFLKNLLQQLNEKKVV